MNILIVSQYFWPESFKINDLALGLADYGHKLTILTGKPNYPEGKFYDGYNFNSPKYENWNGIDIYRLPLVPRGNGSKIKLALNYISFPFFGWLLWRKKLKGHKFDAIFVNQLSPVFVALPAIGIKKKLKIPLFMWVLDIWPDSLFEAGNINPVLIRRPLNLLIKHIYKSCDLIFISSNSFSKSIISFGIMENKIKYLPNWAEDLFLSENNIEVNSLPVLNEGFNVMFAGNIGEAQDVETIIKAATELADNNNITWYFVGDGRKRKWLTEAIAIYNLTGKVIWLGKFPQNTMPYFYSKASVMLVSLKDKPVLNMTVPAKLQTYMANKKPIISLLSGEGNEIVESSNCGIGIPSGNSELLAKAVLKFANMSRKEIETLSHNGYTYYMEHFNRKILIKFLNEILIDNTIKN